MTRPLRTGEKPEQLSLRLPKELAAKVDFFKEKEGTDRSVIILRALRYWLDVNGNVTTDHEFLNRLDKIEENTAAMKAELEKLRAEYSHERQNYTETIRKQQGTIDTLLEMLSKK